ncbi:MAG: hypothetical protein J6U41_03240 [Lachnospiraceae bacterium]|nr:hypothetical protein [Lachnospiraceae bacterium]MBO7362390.1 hypothetical protein [Lachnospiraceae bacterium]MBO7530361.1 hypothetical protein [Lachnospiraceae bacterium]MBP5252552.1 hypothetical protein [Lachnospiraceae bacterium]MBP5471707.1 hypothetical protein [Lachnospiraceae bacterium]
MAKSGQDKKEQFELSLRGKDVPALTLDQKWYHLLGKVGDEDIRGLEKKLNELLKRQGKINTETRDIKKVKRRLMDEIVSLMDEQQGGSDDAESKIAENKRLLKECNDKLDSYEDEMIELPRMIDSVNKELLCITMEHCYETMQENTDDIEELEDWIRNIRIELKKNLIRKQEKEAKNHEIYKYMHDIFGADVVDLFDMRYNPEEKHPRTAEEVAAEKKAQEEKKD